MVESVEIVEDGPGERRLSLMMLALPATSFLLHPRHVE